MGFTAINASSNAATGTTGTAVGFSKKDNGSSGIRTLASGYFSRGESQTDAPLTTGSKKPDFEGKKRAAPKTDAAKPKRRKRSAQNDIPIAKLAGYNSKAKPQVQPMSSSPAVEKQGKPKRKLGAKKASDSKDSAIRQDSNEDALTRLIPVLAQTTSMDALDSTSAQTSVDSVKANAGQSYTLYQGTVPSTSSIATLSLSQAWPTPNNSSASWYSHSYHHDELSHIDTSSEVKDANPSKKQIVPSKTRTQQAEFFEEVFLEQRVEDSKVDKMTSAPRRSSRLQQKNKDDCFCLDDDSSKFTLHDEFSDVGDEELVKLAKAIEENIMTGPAVPPARKRSQNIREVDEHEDYGGALTSHDDIALLGQTKQSIDSTVKPMLRKPFPPPILDRSPLSGASKSTLLRTCFRIGEALNAGCQAVRLKSSVMIELFARVTSSWRESRKQFFIFKDLYHDKPPHLNGTFELWDQARLWDLDSKPFLQADDTGIMCRAIAKMKRDKQVWRLEILSIWEASWEDVTHVAGICCGETGNCGEK